MARGRSRLGGGLNRGVNRIARPGRLQGRESRIPGNATTTNDRNTIGGPTNTVRQNGPSWAAGHRTRRDSNGRFS